MATPAARLSGEQLLDLVRLPATAEAGEQTCAPETTSASLGVGDAALGSRYAHITVLNEGPGDCTLQGHPGVGARAAWGHPFVLEVDQTDLSSDFHHRVAGGSSGPATVRLAPGQSAVVPVRYTGALGGSESEPLDALVLQLARGTPPVLVQGAPEQAFDLSMFTTVYLGPFQTDPGRDDETETTP